MQVVHRDITPRNVMVDEEGQVKLIDFGIAARASVAGHDVFGTPGHMPPEQMRREEIGPATDIFAVAVLLMELWSAHPPFRRKTPGESLAQMHAPHPKPSDADVRLAPLDGIIGRAMSLQAADRPQNADELARALRKFLQDVDQGDLERGLGARVREARAEASRKQSKVRPDGSLVKPSKPSIPDMGPKTFAVRTEALGWKPEMPEEPSGTRKLPESQPPPPSEDTPKVETIATRPIETPVGPSVTPPSRSTKSVMALGLLLLPLALWGALRLTPTERSRAAVPVVSSNPTPPAPPASATETPAIPSSASLPSAIPEAPSATPKPVSSAPAAPAATGQLFLVGDPGTEVSVDSAPSRPCPAAITVKAGSHRVRFTFGYATTHDSVDQTVSVAAGERVTLRADFTAAVPRIRVEH
jgi:serine/threonine-protein kinase